MNYLKTMIILSSIFLVILFVYFFLDEMFYAYQSYRVDCGFEELNESTTAAFVNMSTNEVTLFIKEESPYYEEIIKHEKCHQKMNELGFPFICAIPPTVLLEEFICYVVD